MRASEIWRLERSIVSKTQEIVRLPTNSSSTWTWDGEFFIFDNSKGLAISNAFFDELQVMFDAQIAITEEVSSDILQIFSTL